MSIIKELADLIRAKNEYKRDYRRLQKSTLDYAAFQNIVNKVLETGVAIDIVTDDGVKMTIRPERADNQTGYESFAEKYKRSRM